MLRALPMIFLATACAAGPETVGLSRQWCIAGFENPESVLVARDGASAYVSNVAGAGDARDGNGFISRISLDGRVVEREFAIGLNAPKGLAQRNGLLYATDIDAISVVEASTGEPVRRIAVPGARFLNDLTFTPDGLLLAADSQVNVIFSVDEEGDVRSWLDAPEVRSVNGLFPESDRLVVTTMQGLLIAVDYETRNVAVLAEGLGRADGVAPLGGGRYLVSHWPGKLYVVERDGSVATILDTEEQGRYINDFAVNGAQVLTPHFEPGEVCAYTLIGRH